MGVCFPLPLL